LPCSTAFEYASKLKQPPECQSQTQFSCPICLSKINSNCWLARFFTLDVPQIWTWRAEKYIYKADDDDDICISEANLLNVASNELPEQNAKIERPFSRLCQTQLRVFRSCSPDHFTLVSCHKLLSILRGKERLPACEIQVKRALPCKHVIIVKCCTINDPPPKCQAQVNSPFMYPCGEHFLTPSKCFELTKLLELTNPQCQRQITCNRFRCGHSVSIPCHLKKSVVGFRPGQTLKRDPKNDHPAQLLVESHIPYCSAESELTNCTQLVSYKYLACGHVRPNVACSTAFSWAADNDLEAECEQSVSFKNPVCGHEATGRCFEIDLIKEWQPWSGKVKPAIKEYVWRHDQDNEPINGYSMKEETSTIQWTKLWIFKS
jgi:hypothetical protein